MVVGVDDVGGGTENEALAPVCADTRTTHINDRQHNKTKSLIILEEILIYKPQASSRTGK